MKRTFQSEDRRKDRLFEAWIQCMLEREPDSWPDSFDEIVEGTAVFSGGKKNQIAFELENGRRIRPVELDPRVLKQLSTGDAFHFVVGRLDGVWQVIEIHSVMSFVPAERGKTGIHFTVNPMLTARPLHPPVPMSVH
jgi:hypothetical protein